VGLLVGISIATGLDGQLSYMVTVVAMWFIAPVAAGLVAFCLIRYINSRKVKNIWQRIRTFKVLLIILAFTSAYTLGANTLGLIVATGGFNWATVAVAVVAVFAGSFFLGEGASVGLAKNFI
jgi:PiT family inorganic phosphate transporter